MSNNQPELNPSGVPMGLEMHHADHGASSSAGSLKRRPSPSPQDDIRRKKFKEEVLLDFIDSGTAFEQSMSKQNLADDLAQELQCGCCAELVYHPVMVNPCQHFFCGSCCVLWFRNGGSNCPVCRGVSMSVIPCRPLQTIVDMLLRTDPSKIRAEGERIQADEIYKAGSYIRIPTPREASPEPVLGASTDYARPCAHCVSGNPFGWRCPQPVPDPLTDPDHAWHLDEGTPPGHAYCGNCESLLALRAPITTKCDFCQVSFCGIGVQGRCLAAPLLSQHPHGMADIGDLIQSAEVYDCFDNNTVEVEIMLDYLSAHQITPRQIYRETVMFIQSQPRGFASLIELELFVDIHAVTPGIDSNPDAPRTRICRLCSAEVLIWGIKDWWIRERRKGLLDEAIVKRLDCSEGSSCTRQKDFAHAKEFNHIISLQEPERPSEASFHPREGRRDYHPSPFPALDVELARDNAHVLTSSQDFRDVVEPLS